MAKVDDSGTKSSNATTIASLSQPASLHTTLLEPGRTADPVADLVEFRGGLVFEAHRLLYHSTLGLRVIKKKKREQPGCRLGRAARRRASGLVYGLWFRVSGLWFRGYGLWFRV